MTYRIFYSGQLVATRASRDDALNFVASCTGSHREEFEILDASDEAAS